MNLEFKGRFISLWEKYFERTEPPFTFYYTDQEDRGHLVQAPSKAHQCIIGVLNRARRGEDLCFGTDSFGCGGAKRYLGYTQGTITPNFEYFLSCGIEGERYKKSPGIVRQIMENAPMFEAPGKFIVFKRWDKLLEVDEPAVVIFYGRPDVLSGLFTLTGFDEVNRDAVIAPFAAGCGAIVQYPYLEIDRDRPRGILGMFDVSARPYVPKDTLSFSVPINKFRRMVEDMEESFLITQSWARVKKRIQKK